MSAGLRSMMIRDWVGLMMRDWRCLTVIPAACCWAEGTRSLANPVPCYLPQRTRPRVPRDECEDGAQRGGRLHQHGEGDLQVRERNASIRGSVGAKRGRETAEAEPGAQHLLHAACRKVKDGTIDITNESNGVKVSRPQA